MYLVDEDDFLVLSGKQQGVQVGGAGDGLPQRLVAFYRQFLRQNRGDLRLSQPGRSNQKGIVQPPMILESGIQGDSELVRRRLAVR